MQKTVLGIAIAVVATSGFATSSHAAQGKVSVPVVRGAKALSAIEKGDVSAKGANWKLPKGNPQPPGRFPSGNPQLKPSK
jgi:hypothetical protein